MRALLLDFDGLVCDTERAAYLSWSELYRQFGYSFPAGLWARMRGRVDGEVEALTDLERRRGRPVDAAARAARLARKRELADAEPTRPGVVELLREAAGRGVARAVVSSSQPPWVYGHLRRLGLAELLTAVVCGDAATRPKPAPDLYLAALRRLGTPATSAVAVEDSAIGVQAARAAGLRCVAVPGSVGTADDLGEADVLLAGLAGIGLDELLKDIAGAFTPRTDEDRDFQ